MKIDQYTRIIFTIIAIFLGLLILGPNGTSGTVAAQPQAVADAFASVEFIPYGRTGFTMFDRKTGRMWSYDVQSKPGLPFERVNSGERVDKPGAEVQKLP